MTGAQSAARASDGKDSAPGLWGRLSEPVDAAWLAAFRFLFGLVLAVSALRFLAYGWVDRLLVAPRFHFKYYGFSWVEALPGPLMHGLFQGLWALGLLVAVGAFYRIASVLLALGFTYFQLVDVSNYLNHYYLAALLAWLLALVPAARVWSVDSWMRTRLRGASPQETVPRLVLVLFRAQVAIVYFFAGIAKAQSDWLIDAQPLRIWLASSTDLPILGPFLMVDGVAHLFSWSGFLFDTTIVAFLLWKRTRLLAFLAVVVFHALTRVLFPIGMFPIIMVLSVLVFFEPSWPRDLLVRVRALGFPLLGGAARHAPVSRVSEGQERSPAFLVATSLAALYLALQVLLPLRAYFYPGNVLWHEQGMRFSFRVMLRAKGGTTNFLVWTPGRDKPFVVSPRRYLTGLQESEMSSQPDLILQLAHHIQRDFQQRGYASVRVFADSRVALNGRRSERFIDPEVDLTTVRDGLGPVSYVLPAPTSRPVATLPTR